MPWCDFDKNDLILTPEGVRPRDATYYHFIVDKPAPGSPNKAFTFLIWSLQILYLVYYDIKQRKSG